MCIRDSSRQPRFDTLTSESDLALGDYTKSLVPLFNDQNISAITELDFEANPELELTSFTRASRRHSSLANVYENSRSKNSQYAKYASRYIQDIANHHLNLIAGLFHAETVTRDVMLEVQEIDHLTEMIYDQAQLCLLYTSPSPRD